MMRAAVVLGIFIVGTVCWWVTAVAFRSDPFAATLGFGTGLIGLAAIEVGRRW